MIYDAELCNYEETRLLPTFAVPHFAILDREQVEQIQEADFDPTIQGPWMNEWEIVNHNEHTADLNKGPNWFTQPS